MKITAVRYRRLVTGHNYSHKAVEAEAAVENGETPEDALTALAEWVNRQVNGEEACLDVNGLREEVNFLHRQRQQLRGACSQAEAEKLKLLDELDGLRAKREAVGIEPDVPF